MSSGEGRSESRRVGSTTRVERHAVKAAMAVASSGSSRRGSNLAVTDESRMDVEGEERDESRGSTAQHRRRTMTKTSME